jgi:hypothetical protein
MMIDRVATKYILHWGRADFEEHDNLRDAIDSIDCYVNCLGGDDDERLPTLYAVLNDGTTIMLPITWR